MVKPETIEITESNKPAILELFNKTVDEDGFIIEKKTGKRLVCPFSKKEISASDFSILSGSSIFITNEYYCFAEYLAQQR